MSLIPYQKCHGGSAGQMMSTLSSMWSKGDQSSSMSLTCCLTIGTLLLLTVTQFSISSRRKLFCMINKAPSSSATECATHSAFMIRIPYKFIRRSSLFSEFPPQTNFAVI